MKDFPNRALRSIGRSMTEAASALDDGVASVAAAYHPENLLSIGRALRGLLSNSGVTPNPPAGPNAP